MGSLLLRMFVGGLAGLVVWAVLEPGAPKSFDDPRWIPWTGVFMLGLGGAIGGSLGALEGYLQGGRVHTTRGLLLGVALGALGLAFGWKVGGSIAMLIFGSGVFGGTSIADLPLQILARTIGLSFAGLGLGAGVGASTMNLARFRNGAIGGLVAGLVAGGLFDVIGLVFGSFVLVARGQTSGEVGVLSRALTAMLLGFGVGLFIGLVERMARRAWVRLVLGRNEGREWSIYGPQTLIGRSETAQIPIFGDPAVAPAHAVILRQSGAFMLADAGSGAPTFLNGHPLVGVVPLLHGATIQVGNSTLEFLLRGARSAQVPYTPVAPAPQDFAPSTPYPTQQPYMPPGTMQPTVAIPATAAPALVATDGPLAGQRFAVHGQLELGRESQMVPMSFDASASRRHASVALTPAGLTISDHGSTNGTYVNGQRVQSATIRPGDLVRIGATTFRVE